MDPSALNDGEGRAKLGMKRVERGQPARPIMRGTHVKASQEMKRLKRQRGPRERATRNEKECRCVEGRLEIGKKGAVRSLGTEAHKMS